MRPLLLDEAARFLRMSRSTLYQRRDIPRYRRPGSRVLLFDQDELEAWLKQGRIEGTQPTLVKPTTELGRLVEFPAGVVVDISSQPVYHRNGCYR